MMSHHRLTTKMIHALRQGTEGRDPERGRANSDAATILEIYDESHSPSQ